ncbi:hypothetical protein Vi05172_g5281 [Venturia inaequalis]|nr:hypothetical protein Vi05172_g5281 [Venturia inaequalis]
MKFTVVLAFLAFASTTLALPSAQYRVPNPPPVCRNGCPSTKFGKCPPSC